MPESEIQKNDERKAHVWGMLCHLTALLGIVGIPFGQILGPLIVWRLKKKAYPFVDEQGRESLNFQLSMTIYALVAALLIYFKIGMFILLLIAGVNAILVLLATIKALNGETFSYPLKIRSIKQTNRIL